MSKWKKLSVVKPGLGDYVWIWGEKKDKRATWPYSDPYILPCYYIGNDEFKFIFKEGRAVIDEALYWMSIFETKPDPPDLTEGDDE